MAQGLIVLAAIAAVASVAPAVALSLPDSSTLPVLVPAAELEPVSFQLSSRAGFAPCGLWGRGISSAVHVHPHPPTHTNTRSTPVPCYACGMYLSV